MSTSTSAPSSSSSSSSSSQGEKELSSLEAFELFFEKLTLKNSTFFVEDYIEEKMIGDEILFNQYYGRFAEYYNDEGYFVYLDQGIYYYEVDEENNIAIGDCQTLNKNSTISEFFQTPYDFYNLRKEWKVTDEDFVFATTNRYVGEIINELGGNGIFNGEYVAKSYQNELRVASDGLSATFVSTITTNGYGDVTSTVLVKDLGTTTCPLVEQFLNEANPLVSTNDFPSSVKNGLREMFGDDVPVPEGASYAYGTEVFTSEGQVVDITYKDYLIGDQVASYREALEQYGFTLSSKTDEKGDLKQYGYVNWYYEITIDSNYYLVHLFFYPKMYLGQYEQGMYPNGIFSVRFRTY